MDKVRGDFPIALGASLSEGCSLSGIALRCAFLALMIGFPSIGRAEVVLRDVRWGFQQNGKLPVRQGEFQESTNWIQPPSAKLKKIPRVSIQLENLNGSVAEGVVLRYVVSARVGSIKNPGKQDVWVVPFWVDRRRVPFIKPNQVLAIQIDPVSEMRLVTSLKEMFQAGFWPNALKIEVMVEPHLGEEGLQKVSEKILPVKWAPQTP